MYLPAISRHIGKLIVAAGLTLGGTPLAFAAHPDMAGTHHPGMTGTHKSYSRIPDGCQFAAHDGTQQPADYLQSFATGLGLSGQQQQDLQILAMDYGERLRDLAKLMGDIGKKLAMTEHAALMMNARPVLMFRKAQRRTKTTATKIARILYSRRRKTIDPSAICPASFRIRSLPSGWPEIHL